jgi:hypothetical protein
MEPIASTGRGETPQSPAPTSQASPAAAGDDRQQPGHQPPARRSADTGLGIVLARLGFVTVVVVAAVVLIALGYAAVAAIEVVLGAGLAAVEIIKRLG